MNKYQNRELHKIFVSFLGSNALSTKGIAIIIMIVVSFAWLPDGLSALFDKIFSGDILKWELKDGTMLCQILGAVLMLYIVIKMIPKKVANVDISIDEEPKKAKALVLFLSQNSRADEDKNLEEIGDFKSNYRMPLISIDYHKDMLEKIILICSDQSLQEKEKFLKCIENIFGKNIVKIIEVKHVANLEMAKDVYGCLEDTYKELNSSGIDEKDIVFDVTGGQKAVSIAGAIFAIPNNRHLQYVSTTDYRVRHYDLTYAQDEY
ncbi:hypothetical protein ACHJH3_07015 [Campylobacter sp. MOP7]|uniref:hypothetical protein n=1 Tax=Campylobacter canis TaxID=3378588 RepID=UPI00387E4311